MAVKAMMMFQDWRLQCYRLCAVILTLVSLAAWVMMLLTGDSLPSAEYQAFIDHYPTSKYYTDLYHRTTFGTTKAKHIPRLLELFDWHIRVGGMPESGERLDRRGRADPCTVLSGVDQAMNVILAAQKWGAHCARRVLVFMGMSGLTLVSMGETTEVKGAVIAELKRIFAEVYTVGNDLEGQFKTMPLGLVEHKVRRTGADQALAAIAASRLDALAKPFGLLAAFDVVSDPGDDHGGPLSRPGAMNISNTLAAILTYGALPFYVQIRMTAPRRSHQAGQVPKTISRMQASKWMRTAAARDSGLITRRILASCWWSELARFRFLLSPMGDEIQAPKQIEALLVLTVPIIQRGPYRLADDLVRLGFPMAVVDEWEQVTRANLNRWWESLAPRLASFRAHCLTTNTYWRIITGEVESCY